ncbi:uncharacterized protein LOC116160874 [Photinus pyralis]|nr:uncharacterized protein LOC116160874 [Photinus pyralis]
MLFLVLLCCIICIVESCYPSCVETYNLTVQMCGNSPSISTKAVVTTRGSNLSLVCGGHENTAWTRLGSTIAKHRLTFNPVRLKHQGDYLCTSDDSNCTLSVHIVILPHKISSRLKRKVFNYIYPAKHKRSVDSESSESDSSTFLLTGANSELSYGDFWIVVFVIFLVGIAFAVAFCILKRYWWTPNGRCRQQPVRDQPELVELARVVPEERPPPYIVPAEDLPPSYEQAVYNKHPVGL